MSSSVEVERAAIRTWLVALFGIPFMLLGADLFLEQKLIGRLGEWIYGSEQLPAFDGRDRLLAALLLLGGALLTGWGLKELILPRRVLIGDEDGIKIAVAGPSRPAVEIPWREVVDLRPGSSGEDGEYLPVLRIELADPSLLPDRPWGARRSGDELVIDAKGWSPPAEDVARALWRLRESVGKGSEPLYRGE